MAQFRIPEASVRKEPPAVLADGISLKSWSAFAPHFYHSGLGFRVPHLQLGPLPEPSKTT